MNYRCPTCRKEFSKKLHGIWPFCSERCKLVDFGRWTREDYRIPASSTEESPASPAGEEAAAGQRMRDEFDS